MGAGPEVVLARTIHGRGGEAAGGLCSSKVLSRPMTLPDSAAAAHRVVQAPPTRAQATLHLPSPGSFSNEGPESGCSSTRLALPSIHQLRGFSDQWWGNRAFCIRVEGHTLTLSSPGGSQLQPPGPVVCPPEVLGAKPHHCSCSGSRLLVNSLAGLLCCMLGAPFAVETIPKPLALSDWPKVGCESPWLMEGLRRGCLPFWPQPSLLWELQLGSSIPPPAPPPPSSS